jgi:ribosome biogenesis ATPase
LEALVGKAGERALERVIDERKHELSKDLMSETNAGRWKKPWLPQEINRFAIKMTDFEVLWICLLFYHFKLLFSY